MSLHESGGAFKIELPQARTFQMQGTLWRVLATGDETGGVVGALDERSAHGIAAPMHVHEDADEIFYVLDGELTFFVGNQRIEAAAGAFVYLPRFVHHGFQVDSEEARIFNFVTPAGFERIVLDNGKPAHYDDAPIPVDPDTHHEQSNPQTFEVFRKKYGMRERHAKRPNASRSGLRQTPGKLSALHIRWRRVDCACRRGANFGEHHERRIDLPTWRRSSAPYSRA